MPSQTSTPSAHRRMGVSAAGEFPLHRVAGLDAVGAELIPYGGHRPSLCLRLKGFGVAILSLYGPRTRDAALPVPRSPPMPICSTYSKPSL